MHEFVFHVQTFFLKKTKALNIFLCFFFSAMKEKLPFYLEDSFHASSWMTTCNHLSHLTPSWIVLHLEEKTFLVHRHHRYIKKIILPNSPLHYYHPQKPIFTYQSSSQLKFNFFPYLMKHSDRRLYIKKYVAYEKSHSINFSPQSNR